MPKLVRMTEAKEENRFGQTMTFATCIIGTVHTQKKNSR